MKAKMAAGRPARRSDPPVSLKTQTQFSSWTIALGCVFQPDGSLRPAALPSAIFALGTTLPLRGKEGLENFAAGFQKIKKEKANYPGSYQMSQTATFITQRRAVSKS